MGHVRILMNLMVWTFLQMHNRKFRGSFKELQIIIFNNNNIKKFRSQIFAKSPKASKDMAHPFLRVAVCCVISRDRTHGSQRLSACAAQEGQNKL